VKAWIGCAAAKPATGAQSIMVVNASTRQTLAAGLAGTEMPWKVSSTESRKGFPLPVTVIRQATEEDRPNSDRAALQKA